MSRVQIIAERLSSLSYKFASENGIHLFPVNVIRGDEVLKDSNDEEGNRFIHELESFEEIPSTAVPSVGEMKEIFDKATSDTKEAIYISTSDKLSSLNSVGQKVAKLMKKEGKDVRVFNSLTTVSMLGMYVYKANELSKDGRSIDDILSDLDKIQQERRIVEYGVIGTLKYLEKGGRIGKAKAWMANIFSFKPIISARDGELEPVSKARTDNQALEIVTDKIKSDIERTGKSHITAMYDYGDSDEYLRDTVIPRFDEEFKPKTVSVNQVSIAIACHFGPKVWGVSFLLE